MQSHQPGRLVAGRLSWADAAHAGVVCWLAVVVASAKEPDRRILVPVLAPLPVTTALAAWALSGDVIRGFFFGLAIVAVDLVVAVLVESAAYRYSHHSWMLRTPDGAAVARVNPARDTGY